MNPNRIYIMLVVLSYYLDKLGGWEQSPAFRRAWLLLGLACDWWYKT